MYFSSRYEVGDLRVGVLKYSALPIVVYLLSWSIVGPLTDQYPVTFLIVTPIYIALHYYKDRLILKQFRNRTEGLNGINLI